MRQPILALRGDASVTRRDAVAIVGSRNASAAGLAFAERLARGLSSANYVVTSGLARGIDAVADFLKGQLLPQDAVAVMAWNRATDFTVDHQRIVDVVERYRTRHEGIETALRAMLVDVNFLFRTHAEPPATAVRNGSYRLSALELASRLSFFLWSSVPDAELLKLAQEGRLSKPSVLAAQVKRMLADDRAKSLSGDFAFQWLGMAKLDTIVPDRAQFPQASGLFDPRDLYREELQRFIDSVLRSDQSVMALLTADYTFLNERLAMLYGIEDVKGARFRRVKLADESRYGLLGKGAVDFPGVLAALRAIGYDGWIVVEQDILPGMGDPKESARRNREYLRGIGLP